MRRFFFLFALFLALAARAEIDPEWTTPVPPFQIADNLYYVGSQDLAAYLVTTPAGNILINANLETSPPQIRASVEKLGFKWADTKILLNGQAHFDQMALISNNSSPSATASQRISASTPARPLRPAKYRGLLSCSDTA